MGALVSYVLRVGFLCRKELLVLLADPRGRAMMFMANAAYDPEVRTLADVDSSSSVPRRRMRRA